MDDGTIVPLVDGYLDIAFKPKVDRQFCSYYCKRIEIDVENRRVECQDCHQEVNPFDYICEWAKKGERRMEGLKRLDAEIRLKHQALEAMEREYRRVRGQLDRLDRPARKVVERQIFDQKYNPHIGPQIVSPLASKEQA